jgi:hypothetical protein
MVIRKPAKRTPPRVSSTRRKSAKKNVWQTLIDLGNLIPDEELARLPRDGAKNADHYLHGSPKQD